MTRATASLCIAIFCVFLGGLFKPAGGGAFPTLGVLFVVSSQSQLGKTGKATGFWLPELTHPYYAAQGQHGDRRITVTIASPRGGRAPIDPRSIDLKDPDNKRFLEDPETKKAIENTVALSQVNPVDYFGVLFVGGHGPMWDFVDDTNVQKIAKSLYHNGRPVAAVCHGPAALVNVKLKDGKYLVAGKKVTGFTNAEEKKSGYEKVVPFLLESKLKERGGKFVAAAPYQPNVVTDGLLITGQNPASARKFGEKFVELAVGSFNKQIMKLK